MKLGAAPETLVRSAILSLNCVPARWQGPGRIAQDEAGVWDPFSLEDLLSAGLEAHLVAVAAISVTAQREWCA